MKKPLIITIFLFCTFLYAFEPLFVNDPALSPDGEKVCFCYLGDLWLVNYEGGNALRLTSTSSRETGPLFSPDGKYLVYNSNKDGQYTTWRLDLASGSAQKVTSENVSVWDYFPDGKSLLVAKRDYKAGTRFFQLGFDGKRPLEICSWGDDYASLSPDGKEIAFCVKGDPYREKYTGSGNGELWSYSLQTKNFTRLTTTDYTERYPVYSFVKKERIYYAASDGEYFQLYYAENGDFKQPIKLTTFTEHGVRDISIARANDRLAFEYFNEIYTYNPQTKKSQKLKINIAQDCFDATETYEEVNNRSDEFAVSPNGKIIVFIYKYDLFMLPEKGGEVKQLTFDHAATDNFTFLSDNKTLLFTKYVNGRPQLFRCNLETSEKSSRLDFFKDKWVESVRTASNRQVVVRYGETRKRNLFALADSTGANISEFLPELTNKYEIEINEDGSYAFIFRDNPEQNSSELYLYDFRTEALRKILVSNDFIRNIIWGADGKTAFYNKRDEIIKLELSPENDYPDYQDNWKDIFKTEKKAKDKPKNATDKTEIKWDGLGERTKALPCKAGKNYVFFTENDTILYYMNYSGGKKTLRRINYNGKKDEEVLVLPDEVCYEYNKEHKDFYFASPLELKKRALNGGEVKKITFDFTYKLERTKLNFNVFKQVWGAFGYGFYDYKMHAVNWEKLYKKYAVYGQGLYNTEMLEAVVDEMIGEVNASHTGFYPREDKQELYYQKAYLGAEFDYRERLKEGIKVQSVYRNSTLAQVYNITRGDILLSIDNTKISETTCLDSLLLRKAGKPVKLVFLQKDKVTKIILKGLSSSEAYDLNYDNWVYEREQKVEELSDGRIGYLHIRQMDEESYQKFLSDVYAKNYAKKALIIDVRNNGGGHIHDKLIETLTKKTYAYNTSRNNGGEKENTPANITEMPKVLLINENSFSDAEIFPYLFSEFKLGKIIGMPTSGGVIGTTPYKLMDGSSMRMPRSGWYRLDGSNLELNGAKPDITVEPTPKDIIDDNDIQLQTAVNELLKQI